MKPISSMAVAALLLAGLAHAAELPPERPAAPAEPKGAPEPVVENVIVEDEGMRVDELKVRGETRRISVRTKGRLKSQYEILVPQHGNPGSAAGQRVWSVLAF